MYLKRLILIGHVFNFFLAGSTLVQSSPLFCPSLIFILIVTYCLPILPLLPDFSALGGLPHHLSSGTSIFITSFRLYPVRAKKAFHSPSALSDTLLSMLRDVVFCPTSSEYSSVSPSSILRSD
jgi:hypothetical protein